MLTVGLYQATKAEIESPTLPRPHSVHLEAVAFKSEHASRNIGSLGWDWATIRYPYSAGLLSNIPFRANRSYKTLCNHMLSLVAKSIQ